ncbi:hypothetical protein PENTCL1PPCAC_15261, partial [Pristionchus entomophagus]
MHIERRHINCTPQSSSLLRAVAMRHTLFNHSPKMTEPFDLDVFLVNTTQLIEGSLISARSHGMSSLQMEVVSWLKNRADLRGSVHSILLLVALHF